MAQPIKKYYGSINIDGVSEAKHLIETHEKYGKQLKVSAAQWEDGGISFEVWDKDAQKSYKLGRLMVSQFDGAGQTNETAAKPDLPF